MKKISPHKIAIIGCGKQAEKHIKGLQSANADLRFVLIDTNEQAARKLGEQTGQDWTTDLDGALQDPALVAVDICTPTQSHKPLIAKSVGAGKDFFCEKPLCESLSEARDIAGLVQKSGRTGMIGYIYRFAPVFEQAKDIISSGALGKPVAATFRIGGRGSHQVWKHMKKTGGGAINEMLVHMLDLAIWYFGKAVETQVLDCKLLRPARVIQGKEETVDAEDWVVVRARMENGAEVLFQADMITPAFSQSIEIQGENGTLVASIQPDRPSYVHLDKAAGNWPAGKTVLKTEGTEFFNAQMKEFLDAVAEKRAPRRCTVEDSVLVLEALDNIRKQVK